MPNTLRHWPVIRRYRLPLLRYPRWAALSEDASQIDYEFDGEEVDDHNDQWVATGAAASSVPAARRRSKRRHNPGRRTRGQWDELIRAHFQQKSREELVELVWSLVGRFPELRQEFQERIELREGDVDRLVAAARREMRAVTSEPGWRNSWTGEGHTPDYSRLKHKLERLSELGHCDEVLSIGASWSSLAWSKSGTPTMKAKRGRNSPTA